jgi:hypothetical protein
MPSNTVETGTANPTLCNTVSATRDGWYTFTTGPTTSQITLEATTNRPWVVAIYSGNCTGFSQVACDNAGQNTAITLNPTVLPNTTYYIRIGRTNVNTNPWTGTVCVIDTTPVSVCGSTTNITSCGTVINTTIAAGTGSFGTSACGFTTGGIERVFTFTPTVTGSYSIQELVHLHI